MQAVNSCCLFLSVMQPMRVLFQRWCGEPGGPVWGSVHRADCWGWSGRHCSRATAIRPPTLYPQKLRWVFPLSDASLHLTIYYQLKLCFIFFISLFLHSLLQWSSHILQVHHMQLVMQCLRWQQTTSCLASGASQWSRSSNCKEETATKEPLPLLICLNHPPNYSLKHFVFTIKISS